MADGENSSSSASEEYCGADGDHGSFATPSPSKRPPSSVPHSNRSSASPARRPWEVQQQREEALVDDVHRRMDGKPSVRRGSKGITKDTYAKSTKQCVRNIRKQSRLGMLSGTNSKMTSPEHDGPENPFQFPHSVSSMAVGTPGSAAKPVTTHLSHRNKRTKKRNKDRSYDRDLKLLGADYDHGGRVTLSQSNGPLLEVETSSQFMSLASRRVDKEKENNEKEERSVGFRRHSLSRSASRWPNCPRERIRFYEHFAVLIELGSKAKRKREEQLRKGATPQAPEAFRNELKDVLWLELQAWMHNLDLHHQDTRLMQEREKIDGILRGIQVFRIDDPDLASPCFIGGHDLDTKYIWKLHMAFKQVHTVHKQLEDVEHLYPCTKNIGLSHPVYENRQFQDKVRALNMWSNFYMQLSYRLQSVAGIVCGRKNNDAFPKLFTSTGDCIPEVEECSGDVLDGLGPFGDGEGSRSGLSSRCSSYYDMRDLDQDDVEANAKSMKIALRAFLEKGMRKRGLEKTISQIKNLIFPTLRHILKNLEQPVTSAVTFQRQSSAPEGRTEIDVVKLWCDLHKESNLPCLDRVFIHLLRLPIRTLREGIALRLEQRPEGDPDVASLNQLIHECKDTLILAISIRKDYIELGSTIRHHEVLHDDIRQLDELMKKLLELYLEYLQQWILTLQKEIRASRLQKTVLEDEWQNMTQLCGGIDDAELELPQKFCAIVQGLLSGIGTLLDSGLDDFISSLYQAEEGLGLSPTKDMFRQFFRDCKIVFIEAKERCFKLLEFTKLLHKDLEIAAIYEMMVSMPTFLSMLVETNHYYVDLAAADTDQNGLKYRFFVSQNIGNNGMQVARLLNATLGGRETENDMEGYLLIVPATNDKWTGRVVKSNIGALTAIRHSHIDFDAGNVMLVALKNGVLALQSKQFEKRLPKDYVKPSIPQTTCHQIISQALEDIKEESLELGKKICSVILRFQEEIRMNQFPEITEQDRSFFTKSFRDLLHMSYNFSMEYHRELARLNFSDEEALATQLFDLARQWMDFVVDKCERGHGTRPRWSTPGLDYLTVAVRPNYTKYMTEELFQSFKTQIDTCVTHVIGDPPQPGQNKTPVESPTTFYLSPPQSSIALAPHRSSLSLSEGSSVVLGSYISRLSSKSDTAYESSEEDDSEMHELHHRVEDAVDKLDKKRNDYLMKHKLVGMVVPTESTKNINHLKSRKVDFRWRLCNKLGSGRHADVYKVMNLDTGGLLAVKKFSVNQSNKSSWINKLATEIEWLAGLKHPNVVQYFGVEIHREELLLFMEYCDGGTLSDVARQGLDIIMVRVYAKQLLMGIHYLHDNAICHLDIKGQNVFLTSEGCVKLGDFSEMVKLESGDTRSRDVQNNTGTPRFMSPEMIRGDDSNGIGRATDIWSYGCVVVEMITGKTPKFDKIADDNEYAIMFHVGAGGRPKIPDTLSPDGKDFLDHCFEKNPDDRWRADRLLKHPFVTIDIGGDL
ncbi:mitogen-activated protein kinase kinase kinase 4-like [Paramacrobiotus metropolitanus]|uniref:mitogen-activated protein kinase kinase kinase 4-like n=1 Tax=Paramacrobiotus metropolitanus TaxID=2943436 RepID=UPI002445E833|nr:mitogen-activated protein kinase kinase kinase 4-like [Paramacrobiotus metropolitanus]